MKQFCIIVFGAICFLFSCKKDNSDDLTQENIRCFEENIVNEKSTAKFLILGSWNWKKTIYPRRTGTIVETPESKNENRSYEFTDKKMNIYVNGILASEHEYVVQNYAEGTTLEEEELVVKFEESGGQSILLLSTSGNYLSLINSYNDAGGDICLHKE